MMRASARRARPERTKPSNSLRSAFSALSCFALTSFSRFSELIL
jgi:hypothetical protein